MSKTEKRKTGDFGETVACKFLVTHGFSVVQKNYSKKWGEIDVVATRKDGREEVLHFVEVKTVVRKAPHDTNTQMGANDTNHLEAEPPSGGNDEYEAEENVHPWKIKRLSRTIQTYLLEKKVDEEKEFQCDVVTVVLDPEFKKARVKYIPDIDI